MDIAYWKSHELLCQLPLDWLLSSIHLTLMAAQRSRQKPLSLAYHCCISSHDSHRGGIGTKSGRRRRKIRRIRRREEDGGIPWPRSVPRHTRIVRKPVHLNWERAGGGLHSFAWHPHGVHIGSMMEVCLKSELISSLRSMYPYRYTIIPVLGQIGTCSTTLTWHHWE